MDGKTTNDNPRTVYWIEDPLVFDSQVAELFKELEIIPPKFVMRKRYSPESPPKKIPKRNYKK